MATEATDYRRFYTVWDFRSVDGKECIRVAKAAEPDDHRFQHEYQKIAGQVLAHSKTEALAAVNAGAAK